MKKWISVILVITLVMMISGIATAVEAGEDAAPVMFTSNGEEKVYCNATLEDDFAENRIMVVLSNDASLDFNTYETADFGEIGCAGVKNLSQASGRKIQAKAEALKAAVMTRSVDLSTLDTSGIDTYNQVLCLELEDGGKENVLAAIDELIARDDVIYAGPDYVISLCATTPDDTHYNHDDNWAPDVIDLPEAWDITTGSANVVVGVIDSGIFANHPDLQGNVNVSASFDFTDEGGGETTDPHGHGTHVAGIIGAVGDNEKGIAGVCWNVTLVSLRVFNSDCVGYTSDVANAIMYAENLGIPILNLSGSWTTDMYEHDLALQSTMEAYSGLIVCSAGNKRVDCDNDEFFCYGFNLSNMIVVGASNSEDEIWVGDDTVIDFNGQIIVEQSGSNYGKTTVDIFAPGVDILSCYSSYKCVLGTHYTRNESHLEIGYHFMTGTSMAAPYVTGVAALLLSENPDLLPCEIKDTILSNVDDCGTAFDDYCISGGRINAYNALTNVKRHTRIYADLGTSAGHRTSCVECGCYRVHLHRYTNVSRYNALKHAVACMCGNVTYEAHSWNATRTLCLSCGYDINGPVELYVLKPDEE